MAISKRDLPPCPSLIDLLLPKTKPVNALPWTVAHYKFKYYAGEGQFKGTNDEVVGWNTNRPGWFGFLTKADNRWYIHKDDLTPESLELALKELAEKEEEKAKRSAEFKAKELLKIKAREAARRKRGQSSTLDGREKEVRELTSTLTFSAAAKNLGCTRRALERKLALMGTVKRKLKIVSDDFEDFE